MQLKETYETYGHSFDEVTGLYLFPIRIYPEADGSCPLPDNTVDFPPMDNAGARQAWRINADRTAWETVADFRGVMLWDKDTGLAAPNMFALGDLPSPSLTAQAPLAIAAGQPAANRWNVALETWELVPDFSQTAIWEKATGLNLPPLPVGEPLPATATDLAPPRDSTGPWQYSDAQSRWESMSPPVETLPAPPQSTTDVAGA
jgi:hypothetical protein